MREHRHVVASMILCIPYKPKHILLVFLGTYIALLFPFPKAQDRYIYVQVPNFGHTDLYPVVHFNWICARYIVKLVSVLELSRGKKQGPHCQIEGKVPVILPLNFRKRGTDTFMHKSPCQSSISLTCHNSYYQPHVGYVIVLVSNLGSDVWSTSVFSYYHCIKLGYIV